MSYLNSKSSVISSQFAFLDIICVVLKKKKKSPVEKFISCKSINATKKSSKNLKILKFVSFGIESKSTCQKSQPE